MNLQLSLIEFWFNMTKPIIKKEDYRSVNPYWCNRFILFEGKTMPKKWWKSKFDYAAKTSTNTPQWIIYNLRNGNFKFKSFTTNTMTLGYPSSTDKERILIFEHAGIEIRTGNPDWGAEPNKIYFVIKHGKRIQ